MTTLVLGVRVCTGCELPIRGESYRGYCTEQCYCWYERTVDSDSLERLKVEAAALLNQQETERKAEREAEHQVEYARLMRLQQKKTRAYSASLWSPGKYEKRWTPEAPMTAPGIGLVHIGWSIEGRETRPHLRYPEE